MGNPMQCTKQSMRSDSPKGVEQLHVLTSLKPMHVPSKNAYLMPFYSSKVQAGFPSPADDYIERHLDLNAEYIKHPSATFLVKATGESMRDVGIFDGDVLIIDKSLEAADGSIVIAALNGELTVKRLSRKNGRVRLLPANPKFQPIDISDEQDMVVWGVVTLVLHVPR